MTFGYLRVSTDKQDENNQKTGVERKARLMGLEIDEYVIDSGVSGTKEPEKRNLGKLLEKAKSGDVIIASELSRLGRSLYMVMRILERLMKNEVKVITVKDNYELGNNITSKVLAFAFALAAEIERDMISQRTKEALRKKMAEGLLAGRPRGSVTGCRKLKPHHDEIKKELEAGASYCSIMKKIGVHRNTIMRYCKDNGLDKLHDEKLNRVKLGANTVPVITRLTNEAELLKQIEAGKTYNDIGKQLGISTSSVRTFIQNTPMLLKHYQEIQNAIREAANGGLRINKEHSAKKHL
ncbi:MAG: recombinase family protein [Spirochaetaceae bacterium]|jgi:DNA invertase Pin-like site-specific DNA recombinase|nr:recombinase family protein [Spirochaetaceae bacterium]